MNSIIDRAFDDGFKEGRKEERERIVGIIEKRIIELQELIERIDLSFEMRGASMEKRNEARYLLSEIESKK